MKKGAKLAIGTIAAGVAGYVTGLLTAPKSGKQTRKDIKDASLKAKAEAEKKLKELHTELNKIMTDARQKAKGLSDKASKEMNAAINKAQTAKDKAKQLLSSLHEGDTGDEDLQKAIQEVTSATKHLKKYLGNYVEQVKNQK